MTNWISTTKANALFNGGITDRTFRVNFQACLPHKVTPGGKLRWDEEAVKALGAYQAPPARKQ